MEESSEHDNDGILSAGAYGANEKSDSINIEKTFFKYMGVCVCVLVFVYRWNDEKQTTTSDIDTNRNAQSQIEMEIETLKQLNER